MFDTQVVHCTHPGGGVSPSDRELQSCNGGLTLEYSRTAPNVIHKSYGRMPVLSISQ